MELSAAIRAVIATFRDRPDELLPWYLLGLAAPGIARIFMFAGFLGLYLYYQTTGRLAELRAELVAIDWEFPDPESDPDAFVEWIEGLEPIVEILVTPTSVGLLLISLGLTVLALFVLAAMMEAAQMATSFARLRQEPGIRAGIGGLRDHWVAFLALYLLEGLLWFVVTAGAIALVGAIAMVSLGLAVLVGVVVFFLWVATVVVIRGLFVFAPVSIIVDEASVLGSLRASGRFIRRELMSAVGYFAVSIGLIIGFGSLTSTAAPFGGAALGALAGATLLGPALHLLKTVLYGEYREAVEPPKSPERGLLEQVRAGMGRGLTELKSFVVTTPGLHGLSTAVLLGGFAAGWLIAEPFLGLVELPIRDRLVGVIPPLFAIEIFGNNWTVMITTAYAGIFVGIPAIVSLIWNGVALGFVGRLEPEPEVLMAFVIPHGILEVPVLIVSGALGLYLGLSTWRTWRGQRGRVELAEDLKRAFWVLIGVGILVAVAAFVEGFISPYYWRLFL